MAPKAPYKAKASNVVKKPKVSKAGIMAALRRHAAGKR